MFSLLRKERQQSSERERESVCVCVCARVWGMLEKGKGREGSHKWDLAGVKCKGVKGIHADGIPTSGFVLGRVCLVFGLGGRGVIFCVYCFVFFFFFFSLFCFWFFFVGRRGGDEGGPSVSVVNHLELVQP